MNDIRYEVQGVPLTDERWAARPVHTEFGPVVGVRTALRGTALLPSLPGLRVTTVDRAGMDGEAQVQHAPIMPKGVPLVVRFHAVDGVSTSPTYGTFGVDVAQRAQYLEYNINDFLFRSQIGATSSKGNLRLTRKLGASRPRHTVGRIISSADPIIGPGYAWADYHFIFHSQIGTWYEEWRYVSALVDAKESRRITVPVGTAPVPDVRIAIRRTNSFIRSGVRFLNDQGVGFETTDTVPVNQWKVMDTAERHAGNGGTGDEPNWNARLTDPYFMAEVGRPMGTALRINPGVGGIARRIGVITVQADHAVQVRVAIRPRYF